MQDHRVIVTYIMLVVTNRLPPFQDGLQRIHENLPSGLTYADRLHTTSTSKESHCTRGNATGSCELKYAATCHRMHYIDHYSIETHTILYIHIGPCLDQHPACGIMAPPGSDMERGALELRGGALGVKRGVVERGAM